tara:strand:- start:2882 stop:5374 length:2493 start_codon:yes stop_codon:yes gene_type:complete
VPISVTKDNPLTVRVIQFFEKMRMSYLSALSDPKTYGKKWITEVKTLREQWDDIDDFSKEIKQAISEKELFDDEAENVESDNAKNIYSQIKELRYSSDIVKDPFANQFGEDVIDKLLTDESIFAKFIHWAIRSHDKSLIDGAWEKHELEPDTITEGFKGLNLAKNDVIDFIVEHYGDGKDTKRIKGKYKAARKLLEEIYVAHHSVSQWDKVVSLEKAEKADTHFLIPNKPMYRIFDISDLEELKGFTGKWVVQEKYDGMRIQIHKIDSQIKIYSFNGKDITEKCPEQVKVMKAKHFGDCILDAELMLFDKDEPLHRAEVVSLIFKGKESETELRAHVFDIIKHEDRQLHEEELSERLTILFNNYSTHSDEKLAFPSKKDTRYADSIKEVEEYAKEIMEIPTAEGVVIKDITSTYFIGTKKNPKWIKWKKFVDLDLIVLDKKTTKSNMFTYTLGAGPLTDKDNFKNTKIVDDRKYLNVGKALNTKTDVEIGSIIRVKIDEVKKDKDGGYKLFSAKVIEIPEVELPEKLITLDLLSQDTKKSLNYDVKALEKGYTLTDTIHGETTAIIKSDLDGFTFYGFEENNLMSKNALLDIDIWKTEIEEMLKTDKAKFRVSIKNFLLDNNRSSFDEIEEFVEREHIKEFNNLFESKSKKLKDWLKQLEDITYDREEEVFLAEYDMLEKDIEKAYKTPKEYRHGKFKLYYKDNENLSILFNLDKETIGWEIDIDNEEDIFSLFGKSGKFPAQIERHFREGKLIDSGNVELGVQRNGYHEYILEGNKFDTKFHVRVIPVKDKEMWLAWTGLETKPVDSDTDAGIWDITNDKFSKLKIRNN